MTENHLPALNDAESAFEQASALERRMLAAATRYETEVTRREAEVARLVKESGLKDPQQIQDLKDNARREAFNIIQDKEFLDTARKARALHEVVAAAAEHYGDPLRLAELTSIDDPERAHYSAVVRGLGHAALETLSQKARSEKKLALAVALGQEVAPIARRARPFDVAGLIAHCLPDASKAKAAQFKQAKLALDRAWLARNRIQPIEAMRRSSASSLDKIRYGLENGLARREKA